MVFRQSVYDRLPSRLAGNYAFLFGTKTGTFCRFCLLTWISVCFMVAYPPIAMVAFSGAFYMMVKTILVHTGGWYKFLGGATPSQLARSYNKIWHGSVNQPLVTKVIKAPPSGPIPWPWWQARITLNVILVVCHLILSTNSLMGQCPVTYALTAWVARISYLRESFYREGCTDTEEITRENALQLEMPAMWE